MLSTQDDPSEPPKLCGIIDWDDSRTGLLYELLEYPIFIQDVEWSPELYTENKTLRKYFVRCLANKFPKGSSDREDVKECFRMKSWILQNFQTMWVSGDNEMDVQRTRQKLESIRSGTAAPYEGKLDWEPDSELESEDEEEG